MSEWLFPQALFRRTSGEGPVILGRSAGFQDGWIAEAEDLLLGFGARPAGVRCPHAVFAQALTDKHVAVVQVADLVDMAGAGEPALGFHVLAVEEKLYQQLGDPFALADRVPPAWEARGDLPEARLPAEAWPRRTIQQVQRVLQRVKAGALKEGEDPHAVVRTVENSESPALLGGVQVLLDGGRLVFERPAPDPDLLRALWTLLPYSARATLWPASFAFSNALGFDALVVPRALGDDYEGYTTEEQAADYPQGRYELNLQIAAESGDQVELDHLLNRRSLGETKKLGVILLVLLSILVVLTRVTEPEPTPTRPRQFVYEAAAAAGIVAVGDPLTALGMLRVAKSLWGTEGR